MSLLGSWRRKRSGKQSAAAAKVSAASMEPQAVQASGMSADVVAVPTETVVPASGRWSNFGRLYSRGPFAGRNVVKEPAVRQTRGTRTSSNGQEDDLVKSTRSSAVAQERASAASDHAAARKLMSDTAIDEEYVGSTAAGNQQQPGGQVTAAGANSAASRLMVMNPRQRLLANRLRIAGVGSSVPVQAYVLAPVGNAAGALPYAAAAPSAAPLGISSALPEDPSPATPQGMMAIMNPDADGNAADADPYDDYSTGDEVETSAVQAAPLALDSTGSGRVQVQVVGAPMTLRPYAGPRRGPPHRRHPRRYPYSQQVIQDGPTTLLLDIGQLEGPYDSGYPYRRRDGPGRPKGNRKIGGPAKGYPKSQAYAGPTKGSTTFVPPQQSALQGLADEGVTAYTPGHVPADVIGSQVNFLAIALSVFK
eukprot:gene6870-7086_t